jgi:AAA15 family ATPase/GTPase
MKLRSLYVQNFRLLEDFEVRKLGRVNLIVGKNNSGKSSVLEVLRIYAGGASSSLLRTIAEGHDEIYQMSDDTVSVLPYESFFTGRNFPTNDEVYIIIGESKDSPQSLRLKHIYYTEELRVETRESGEKTTSLHRQIVFKKNNPNKFSDKQVFQAILVSQGKEPFLIRLHEPKTGESIKFFEPIGEKFPCGYIPTQFISFDELADTWDKITLTEYEEQVKRVLKFIEPSFESLAFIKNNNKRSPIVKVANSKPIPLNSMGDGMVRILQLALKIFYSKNGFLLIDEFENGLHYSLQAKIWGWLFEVAERLNIQIFATTHSLDCVDSFIKTTLEKKNIPGILLNVGHSAKTSDKNKIIATVYEADELSTISRADVEVR